MTLGTLIAIAGTAELLALLAALGAMVGRRPRRTSLTGQPAAAAGSTPGLDQAA